MNPDNRCLLCGSDLADYDGTICGSCADAILGDGHGHKQKSEVNHDDGQHHS